MNTTELFTYIGVVASVLAAIFGLWQLLLTRESKDVEWDAYKISDGTFKIRNNGSNTAYKVVMQAWTETEISESVKKKKVKPGEYLTILLPEREANGPAKVNVPQSLIPRVSDEPPSSKTDRSKYGGMLDNMYANMDRQWEQRKKMQDMKDAMYQQMAEAEIACQVTYKVRWRSRLGQWETYDSVTG